MAVGMAVTNTESSTEVVDETEQVQKAEGSEDATEVAEVSEELENEDPKDEEEAEVDAPEDGGNEEEGDDEDDDEEEEEDDEEEEDLVDPQDGIQETCTNSVSCRPLLKEFEKCEERVNSRTKTEETCLPEYIDFIKCRDSCVARDLFSKLK